VFATRGYAYVLVWQTGPVGELADNVFKRQRADARVVLEWLAEQPWCNGCVGVHGVSLLGNAAYSAASVSLDPHMDKPRAKVMALSPSLSFSRIVPTIFLWRQGFAAELALRFIWLAEVGCRKDMLSNPLQLWRMGVFFALKEWPGLLSTLESRNLGQADIATWGRENEVWQGGLTQREADDPLWQARDIQFDFSKHGENCPPIHITAGWSDIFLKQSLDDFEAVSQKIPSKAWLTIYAGGHLAVAGGHGGDFTRATLALYDRCVCENSQLDGWDTDQARVCMELINAPPGEEWLACDHWPPAPGAAL
jgi:predicted acyl esterase